jgi:hypothetical protein
MTTLSILYCSTAKPYHLSASGAEFYRNINYYLLLGMLNDTPQTQ